MSYMCSQSRHCNCRTQTVEQGNVWYVSQLCISRYGSGLRFDSNALMWLSRSVPTKALMLCSVLCPVIAIIFVIGYFCFLKFCNGCVSNTVISKVLFGDVKTSHCCNFFHVAVYFVATHWLNEVADVSQAWAWRGAESKVGRISVRLWSFWDESLQIFHWAPRIWCSKHPLCDPPTDFSKSCLLCFCRSFNILSGTSTRAVEKLCSTLSWWCFWASASVKLLTDQVKYSRLRFSAVSAPGTCRFHSNSSSVKGSALCFFLPKPCFGSSLTLPFRNLQLVSNSRSFKMLNVLPFFSKVSIKCSHHGS